MHCSSAKLSGIMFAGLVLSKVAMSGELPDLVVVTETIRGSLWLTGSFVGEERVRVSALEYWRQSQGRTASQTRSKRD